MKVELIYSTPNYHKLVETVARVCYQSYHKDDVNSHNFIKAIMSKGHISIASVGNMVFYVSNLDSVYEENDMIQDLLTFAEITPFVKQSKSRFNKGEDSTYGNGHLISMNMLTFLDIYNQIENYYWFSELLGLIIAEVDKVPCLKWFYDKTVQLEEIPNEYTAKGIPKLYEPIVLDEDYTALQELDLNDYELGIHATITMNFITDRSANLQFWRHWSGGCELSQRYVERGNAEFRELIGLIEYLEETGGEKAFKLSHLLNKQYEGAIWSYEYILELCEEIGIHKARAKEIARSILPNAITTQCIQSRPYRNWLHLFKLRDSKHAQREIQEDVIHMKRVLNELDVPTE